MYDDGVKQEDAHISRHWQPAEHFAKDFYSQFKLKGKSIYFNSIHHQQISKNVAHDLIRLPKPCNYDDKTYLFVIWIVCENSEMDFNNLPNSCMT